MAPPGPLRAGGGGLSGRAPGAHLSPSPGNAALHFLTETLGWRFLFALLLSIALWARLTLEQNPERRDLYPTDIPVEASGLSPGLVVANEVQPVQLSISAPAQSWRTLEPGSFRAQVDLSGVTPGLVQREVEVQVSDPEVKVLEVIPDKVSVRVEELRTVSVPVRVNQLGNVPFGYRVVGEPVVVPATVQISGPSSSVERVTEAAVAVRLDEVKATVEQTLKPEPRGPTGAVGGVRMEPQLVTVTIRVEQIAGSKTVSVVPQVRGQPAQGYWQGQISVEPPSVQIVAEPALLEQTTVINTAPVDVTGAEADVVRDRPPAAPQRGDRGGRGQRHGAGGGAAPAGAAGAGRGGDGAERPRGAHRQRRPRRGAGDALRPPAGAGPAAGLGRGGDGEHGGPG